MTYNSAGQYTKYFLKVQQKDILKSWDFNLIRKLDNTLKRDVFLEMRDSLIKRSPWSKKKTVESNLLLATISKLISSVNNRQFNGI